MEIIRLRLKMMWNLNQFREKSRSENTQVLTTASSNNQLDVVYPASFTFLVFLIVRMVGIVPIFLQSFWTSAFKGLEGYSVRLNSLSLPISVLMLLCLPVELPESFQGFKHAILIFYCV